MTRKDKMREGFVARNFHIPIDVDDKLRLMAVKNHVRFSDDDEHFYATIDKMEAGKIMPSRCITDQNIYNIF